MHLLYTLLKVYSIIPLPPKNQNNKLFPRCFFCDGRHKKHLLIFGFLIIFSIALIQKTHLLEACLVFCIYFFIFFFSWMVQIIIITILIIRKSELIQIETSSLLGSSNPIPYSGVIDIKNIETKIEISANINHFLNILSERKNNIIRLMITGIAK